mgnify:CR=1 FL=1
MTYTYQEYLEMPKSIEFEKCLEIHQMMLDEIDKDEEAIELYDEIIDKAIDYVALRAKWTYMDKEWKMSEDPGRSRKHDALIVKFNQLERYLKMQGKEAKWRAMLGYTEDDPYNRKVIGDMACFMIYIHSINGR